MKAIDFADALSVANQRVYEDSAAACACEGGKRDRLRYSADRAGDRNDNLPEFLADTEGFEPTTSPSGGKGTN